MEILKLIGFPEDKLWSINFNQGDYSFKEIDKHSGRGKRLISIPNPQLKYLQRAVLLFFYKNLRPSQKIYFHSYHKKRSVLTNAKYHLEWHRWRQFFLLKIDITDFFQSISADTLRWALNLYFWRNYQAYIDDILKISLVTRNWQQFLPTWWPLSPYLSNLVWHYLIDSRLSLLESNKLIKYSRYSDDLTISVQTKNQWIWKIGRIDKLNVIKWACQQVEHAGFNVNYGKVVIVSPCNNQKITWITTNSGKASISSVLRKDLAFYISLCSKYWFDQCLIKWNQRKTREYKSTELLYQALLWKLNWMLSVMPYDIKLNKLKTYLLDAHG